MEDASPLILKSSILEDQHPSSKMESSRASPTKLYISIFRAWKLNGVPNWRPHFGWRPNTETETNFYFYFSLLILKNIKQLSNYRSYIYKILYN